MISAIIIVVTIAITIGIIIAFIIFLTIAIIAVIKLLSSGLFVCWEKQTRDESVKQDSEANVATEGETAGVADDFVIVIISVIIVVIFIAIAISTIIAFIGVFITVIILAINTLSEDEEKQSTEDGL
ncbi:hypothetical protein AK812_SmicGene46682 [Symbiodinium microadriaticum]|uniref:Uncharacterized protein n=1 Tax=Symbiodinium microadriaticum TaxID=2951 RepID=A0A1Q9BTC9_SYMMI|nr:hypothetical protein AK812_SmicGene46682 [Symbiodinium microadriaticum]